MSQKQIISLRNIITKGHQPPALLSQIKARLLIGKLTFTDFGNAGDLIHMDSFVRHPLPSKITLTATLTTLKQQLIIWNKKELLL